MSVRNGKPGLIFEIKYYREKSGRYPSYFRFEAPVSLDTTSRALSQISSLDGCPKLRWWVDRNGWKMTFKLFTEATLQGKTATSKKIFSREVELFSNGLFCAPRGEGKLGETEVHSSHFFPLCLYEEMKEATEAHKKSTKKT